MKQIRNSKFGIRNSLWQLSVSTTAEAEDAVTELLGRIFGLAASAYTHMETGATVVSVYGDKNGIHDSAKAKELRACLKGLKSSGLRIGTGTIRRKRLARENWADSWKRHFKAIEIGSRLLIKPGWIKRRAKKGGAVVVLDPGLSFGTGQHPTTEFCLKALVRWQPCNAGLQPAVSQICNLHALRTSGHARHFKRLADYKSAIQQNTILRYSARNGARWRKSRQRPSLWDVGTGSGILAIAAVKLGFAPVTAIDLDPEAIRAAKANARRNRVNIKFSRQDVLRLPESGGKRYSVICANLQADLLLAARRRLVERLEPGGMLVLAGILRREFDEVARAFEREGLELVKCGVGKEWRSGAFLKAGI